MESVLYSIYALVFESEISLVRRAHSFDILIHQQLARKYRTHALSMKYSTYIQRAREEELLFT